MDVLNDGAMRLRTGRSVWQPDSAVMRTEHVARTPRVMQTDIVIVGAGITGAFLAERFTRDGSRVIMIDRHAPAMGSTAASTAMLLWELDASLLELEQSLGAEKAGLIAGHCQRQVEVIGALAAEMTCDFAFQPSLYLAGDKLDATDLREEHRLRGHLGVEGAYLDSGELAAHGFVGQGGLLYPGSAQVDPVKLARGLLAMAQACGAEVLSPATAMVYETLPDGVRVVTQEQDVILARRIVLANGYEMPDFVPVERHKIMETWAIATETGRATAWPGHALVWEASDPYLYMRSTVEGRVIVGGADEAYQSGRPEGVMDAKIRELLETGAGRWPGVAGAEADFAWTGAFGVTDDSLPFIGRVPGRPDCLAAFGYGGNGITFSALAAEILADELAGGRHPMGEICGLDRA